MGAPTCLVPGHQEEVQPGTGCRAEEPVRTGGRWVRLGGSAQDGRVDACVQPLLVCSWKPCVLSTWMNKSDYLW